MTQDLFAPTLAAAHARIAAVRPADYARSRNALDGAVTRLSPYIAHGFVTLPEVLAGVADKHRLDVQHKFVFELGWREFFQHVWQQQGAGILRSIHGGPLPESAYARELPADIREARTGVPVIDQAVRTLYATSSLPEPDSPVMSTVTWLCASRPMPRNTSCMAGAWPNISGASVSFSSATSSR